MSRWRQAVRALAIAANAYLVLVLLLLPVLTEPVPPEPAGDDWSLLPVLFLIALISLIGLIWQPRQRHPS